MDATDHRQPCCLAYRSDTSPSPTLSLTDDTNCSRRFVRAVHGAIKRSNGNVTLCCYQWLHRSMSTYTYSWWLSAPWCEPPLGPRGMYGILYPSSWRPRPTCIYSRSVTVWCLKSVVNETAQKVHISSWSCNEIGAMGPKCLGIIVDGWCQRVDRLYNTEQ